MPSTEYPTSSSKTSLLEKHHDDVVVIAAYRTAITKGGKGGFKDVDTDCILGELLKEFVKKTNLDVNLVQDMTIGNVLNLGSGTKQHRAAALYAGFPYKVSLQGINRQCGSGLAAINDIANKIIVGEIDCGIAGGVESMSKNYRLPLPGHELTGPIGQHSEAKKCLIPMGINNETTAALYSIPRTVQDEFSAKSYQKAETAIRSRLFKDEILPIEVSIAQESLIVDKDEGVRKGVTSQSLSKIKPAFVKDGVTTAGNTSQISDGAAVVLLMRRSFAVANEYPILAKYVGCSTVGVDPELMGIGPAYAIPKILNRLNLDISDIEVFEINEAFAAQCLYCAEKVGIPPEKLNPRGGAIALGHPLGCTGARQMVTILRELKPGELGVTSMCIGSGMGAASVVIRE